jgi:hypothetical protein
MIKLILKFFERCGVLDALLSIQNGHQAYAHPGCILATKFATQIA